MSDWHTGQLRNSIFSELQGTTFDKFPIPRGLKKERGCSKNETVSLERSVVKRLSQIHDNVFLSTSTVTGRSGKTTAWMATALLNITRAIMNKKLVKSRRSISLTRTIIGPKMSESGM